MALTACWCLLLSLLPLLQVHGALVDLGALPPPPSVKTPADPWFPAFHARMHTAHNNDPAGPFYYKGVYHLFMQQEFTWSPYCSEPSLGKGCHGWGHMASTDLVHWREISTATGYDDAFVPGRWVDAEFGHVKSYFTGSVTVVSGVPHALVPAVFETPNPKCMAAGSTAQGCNFEYQFSTPLNVSDPWLATWSQPKTIARSSQGPQPHTGTWQDPTGAWEDPTTPGRWMFLGITVVAANAPGATVTTWRSNNTAEAGGAGDPYASGFSFVGNFFPHAVNVRTSFACVATIAPALVCLAASRTSSCSPSRDTAPD